MEKIQFMLDRKLLRAALRRHLRALEIGPLERKEREGYLRYPDSVDDLQGWQKASSWSA
jgi:hypothetical protein